MKIHQTPSLTDNAKNDKAMDSIIAFELQQMSCIFNLLFARKKTRNVYE